MWNWIKVQIECIQNGAKIYIFFSEKSITCIFYNFYPGFKNKPVLQTLVVPDYSDNVCGTDLSPIIFLYDSIHRHLSPIFLFFLFLCEDVVSTFVIRFSKMNPFCKGNRIRLEHYHSITHFKYWMKRSEHVAVHQAVTYDLIFILIVVTYWVISSDKSNFIEKMIIMLYNGGLFLKIG